MEGIMNIQNGKYAWMVKIGEKPVEGIDRIIRDNENTLKSKN